MKTEFSCRPLQLHLCWPFTLTTACVTVRAAFKHMVPTVFEKDDDENGHIDFITAASVRACFQFHILLLFYISTFFLPVWSNVVFSYVLL